MDNEFLIIQPSPSALVQSLRDIGYSMESAVADIIDNSITADARNVHINFSWNKGSPWLAITDDGYGMTSSELTKAMQLGSRSPLEERDGKDLGRFGLGLKTAAFSQARQLTLISKKNGDISCREWDLDTIDEDPESGWKLHVLNSEQIQELPYIDQLLGIIKPSGTIVLLRKLDRVDGLEKKLNQQVDDTRRHLELVFHRYLAPSRGRKKLNIQLIIEVCIERQCDPEYVESMRSYVEEYEAVLSIACGAGIQFLAEHYKRTPLLPGINTGFLGVTVRQGEWAERCQGCGDCVLHLTGGICPVTRCAKSLFHGPCGGSAQGICEVGKDVACGWQLIIDRLKELDQMDNYCKLKPYKGWNAARHGGPRRIIREDMI